MDYSINLLIDKIRKHGWNRIYIAIDLHGTILKPNYTPGIVCTEFYEDALKALQYLTKSEKFCLILWSSTPNDLLQEYEKFFADYNIKFDFMNCNNEIKTEPGHYGSYDDKFYFDLVLDDKGGFNPYEWDYLLPLLYRLEEVMDEA